MMFLQADDPYLRLAISLPATEWEAVREFVRKGVGPKLPPFVPPNPTPLAVQRAMATQYRPLLMRLRPTNEAAYVPKSPLSPSDFAAIKRLEEFVATAAHVLFADGERHEAVTTLLDGLSLSLRTKAEEAERDAVDAIVRERQMIPLVECERIRKYVDDLPLDSYDIRLRSGVQALRLRMRIEAYRWKFGTAPARLSDAAPLAETIDPRTHGPFAYERVENDYRLGEEVKPKSQDDGTANRREASEGGGFSWIQRANLRRASTTRYT